MESVPGHLLGPGSVFAFLAGHRRVLFPDEMFADLFPSGRGRPSVPADMVAAVIVLQSLNGLSDAERPRSRTDLHGSGCPHMELSKTWRSRLATISPDEDVATIGGARM